MVEQFFCLGAPIYRSLGESTTGILDSQQRPKKKATMRPICDRGSHLWKASKSWIMGLHCGQQSQTRINILRGLLALEHRGTEHRWQRLRS